VREGVKVFVLTDMIFLVHLNCNKKIDKHSLISPNRTHTKEFMDNALHLYLVPVQL
jgi:hypothetical protein